MNIEVCKWYNNADSPVLFFIDDLANVWVDTNGNNKVDLEEDWGYAKNGENSSFRFLNEEILNGFPDIKATFFTPVGIRVGMIENSPIKSISKMINCDEDTRRFFRKIHEDPKFEIAYHGTTHGKVGKTNRDFKQEWELFDNLEEAIDTIEAGKQIYKEVFGEYPKGGKYCGYVSNDFSDKSIDSTGFLWWSRYWNRGSIEDKNCAIGGEDTDPLTNYDIKIFGINNVIDIPSTINGGLLSGVLNPDFKSLKGIAKIILKKFLMKKKLGQIDYLMNNKLVISIQEHIASSRDDGRRQSPNIFDDKKSLEYIFDYLRNKNVWYCTGTELSEYVRIREDVRIDMNDKNYFCIRSNFVGNKITLKFDFKSGNIVTPSNKVIYFNEGYVTLAIEEGTYKVTDVKKDKKDGMSVA